MTNLRTYGKPPFTIAVLHGGPGAAGEMALVARELASAWGVLEPLQTAPSLVGQVAELEAVLEKNAELPVTLVGFSWGAWLSFILTAAHPALVKKLILISSGPFKEKDATKIRETRLGRLDSKERKWVASLTDALNDPTRKNKNTYFARMGVLLSKADAFDPIMDRSDPIDHNAAIYQRVWREAAEVRNSGRLLALGKHIECPVVALHGDYDPHPAEGVQKPLSSTIKNFRFILIEKCGHKPWIERQAKDKFYAILKEELR
jgi:pimeloyl-ACP methyl ester carboxylesterase